MNKNIDLVVKAREAWEQGVVDGEATELVDGTSEILAGVDGLTRFGVPVFMDERIAVYEGDSEHDSGIALAHRITRAYGPFPRGAVVVVSATWREIG